MKHIGIEILYFKTVYSFKYWMQEGNKTQGRVIALMSINLTIVFNYVEIFVVDLYIMLFSRQGK